MIHLAEINEERFRKLLAMRLPEDQNRFVAPNILSLAQAWLYRAEARPFAVCDDDEVVGFLMLDWDEEERSCGIWRFMIAHELQNRGYGKQAMLCAMDMVRNSGCFDIMDLDYVPGNDVARALYYSLGFRENGEVEDGEIIMTLPLTDTPKLCVLCADEDDMDDFTELFDRLRLAGIAIPDALADGDALRRKLTEEKVKRFVLMGKTIGLAVDGSLLLDGKYDSYREEACAMAGC